MTHAGWREARQLLLLVLLGFLLVGATFVTAVAKALRG